MTDNHDDVDQQLIAVLEVFIFEFPPEVVREAIGDGMNRDAYLEFVVKFHEDDLNSSPELAEEARDRIARIESVLQNQPPFRLEYGEDESINLVMTLENRIAYRWVRKSAIDEELISMLEESLKNMVKEHSESVGDQTVLDEFKSGLQSLPGPSEGSMVDRVKRKVQNLLPGGQALNALKDRIGKGKSRDQLLEMALPSLPEQMQSALAELMNDQPPFRMECDNEGNVHLVLIASGEPVHTWSATDLGLPRPLSWRVVLYSAFGFWFVISLLGVGQLTGLGGNFEIGVLPILLVGLLDGFLYVRRTKGQRWAWRAYWLSVPVVFLVAAMAQGGGDPSASPITWVLFAMVLGRPGYLFIWYKLFGARLILECPNCGALIKNKDWVDAGNQYRCYGCGTRQDPIATGQRATIFGNIK